MMNERIDIPAELYEDEVVCFIADRYHTTPKKVVHCFLVQGRFVSGQEDITAIFRLEDNEMEILRELACGSFSW